MGIDPITHKPFGQLLSDYGNINEIIPPATTPPDHRHPDRPHFSHAENSITLMDPFHEPQINHLNPHFQVVINEAASSSTSSPASNNKPQVNLPSSPSIWSDYLIGDQEQECTNESDLGFENTNSYGEPGVNQSNHTLEVATSVSFVESILNRDREMQMDFPQLFDGYSEY